MNYAPLCSKKMIVGLAAFSFFLLVLKFFVDDIQFTEQQANFVSMLRSIYIGYFVLCLIYTGYIFSVRPNKDVSVDPLDKAALYKNQESIVKFLKRPIILLITSAILLISMFTNLIFSFIAIFFLLGILWRMEYSHRKTFKNRFMANQQGYIDESLILQFKNIVGDNFLVTEHSALQKYAKDETEDLYYPPQVVVMPKTTEEISELMKICNAHLIPVTPRGAGTGLSGGALATKAGLLISFERMNSILHIDEQNLQVTVEPGVITEVLQNAVKEKGLFYPPDPSSKGSCFIGGNIAENSGGPRAVKYGVVRDFVINLEVVLPSGEIMWTGANVLKNSTGYNLTQLIVGSEGTLCLVTKIVLKLLPHPKVDLLMLAPFYNLEHAGAAVSAIFRAGLIPSALELVEADALRIVSAFVGDDTISIDDNVAAHLLIEVDGNDIELLMKDMEAIALLLEDFDCGEILFADDAQQKEALWKMRRRTAEAVKIAGYSIEEDTVVPRANLPQLIKGVKELGKQHDFHAVCYGHAGDGNLHIRIKKEGCPFSLNNPEVVPALQSLFELVKKLGGTISGEHGIGLVQKSYMPIMFSENALDIFRGIKKVFDPNGILNTGKIFD